MRYWKSKCTTLNGSLIRSQPQVNIWGKLPKKRCPRASRNTWRLSSSLACHSRLAAGFLFARHVACFNARAFFTRSTAFETISKFAFEIACKGSIVCSRGTHGERLGEREQRARSKWLECDAEIVDMVYIQRHPQAIYKSRQFRVYCHFWKYSSPQYPAVALIQWNQL
jgi:hypothetical protein